MATRAAVPEAERGKGPFSAGTVEYAAMGLRNILCAERILLLANGTSKAQAVADMCKSDVVTTAIPATFLHLHPDVTVLLDREAAAML